jgi:RimJ/RimL family protein N-acetyltransferase
MAPTIVHLPNGQNLAVTPVFGGLFFKSNGLASHHSPFPAGWTIVINSEDDPDLDLDTASPESSTAEEEKRSAREAQRRIHKYRRPTLRNDHLYISSISNPNSHDFKPAHSPARQIAMMLWATLWWYFHEPQPDLRIKDKASKNTPAAGRPEGEWRISINREGIFHGKVVLPKLERMGLIATEESFVGAGLDESHPEGWTHMFVSRRSFWQLDPRIYLFTLSPNPMHSPFPSNSPCGSRPGSPVHGRERELQIDNQGEQKVTEGLWTPSPQGPFQSGSHLPTYYPPPPPQYVISSNVRHPIRPKPPRQGEIFYTRYIPSLGEYLSFRVASLSQKPVRHSGPVASSQTRTPPHSHSRHSTETLVLTLSTLNLGLSDTEYLHKWMNEPRVAHFWGESGPQSHQEEFLRKGLKNKNSFPVIGCFDGIPFGYFELYWVKEDTLGKYVPNVGDYDRGFHCLVGEQEYRGEHRVKVWLSALVHYLWLADNRTETVMLEPRVDNDKYVALLQKRSFKYNKVANGFA